MISEKQKQVLNTYEKSKSNTTATQHWQSTKKTLKNVAKKYCMAKKK